MKRMKHKYMKKTISMALAAALAFSPVAGVTANAAVDTVGHWAESVIADWQLRGLISGYQDGTFRPNNNITRAEFVRIMNKALGFSQAAEPAFIDVNPNDWFYNDVAIALGTGYCNGYSDGTFKPNEPVTRAEAAVFIARAKGLHPNEFPTHVFVDNDLIPAWAKGYVGATVNSGYMSGYQDGTFGSSNNITRAEAVSSLDRVLKNPSSVTSTPQVTPLPEQTYNENFFIDTPDTVYENKVVNGNLIVSENVKDGKVTIKGTTVKGDLIIRGGGSDTINLKDTVVEGKVIVEKEGVKVRVEGNTNIKELQSKTVFVLAEDSFNGTIGTVRVMSDLGTDKTVEIKVPVDKVLIEKPSSVKLEKNVKTVEVLTDAKDSKIEIARHAKVDRLIANSRVRIFGAGDIGVLEANASEVRVDRNIGIDKTEVASGVDKPIISSSSGSSSGSSGGSSSGDSSSSSNTVQTTNIRVQPGDNIQDLIRKYEGSKRNLTLNFAEGTYMVPAELVYNGTGKFTINCSNNVIFNNVSVQRALPTLKITAERANDVTVNAESLELSALEFNAPQAIINTNALASEVVIANATSANVNSSVSNVTVRKDITINGRANKIIVGNNTVTINANVNEVVVNGNLGKVIIKKSIPLVTVTAAGAKVNVGADVVVGTISTNVDVVVEGFGRVDKIETSASENITITANDSISIGSLVAAGSGTPTIVDNSTGTVPSGPLSVQSISVRTNPTKMEYIVGDSFDATGLVLSVTYTDGTVKDMNILPESVQSDFTSTEVAKDGKTVNITYLGRTAALQGVRVYANISDLEREVSRANSAKVGVMVSENGAGLPVGTKYVPQSVMTAFESAILSASGKVINFKQIATQSEVTSAISTLRGAISTFESAKQTVGQVTPIPPTQSDISIQNVIVNQHNNRIILTAQNGRFNQSNIAVTNFVITDSTSSTGLSQNPTKVVLSPDGRKAILAFNTPAQNVQPVTNLTVLVRGAALENVTSISAQCISQRDVTTENIPVQFGTDTIKLTAQGGEFDTESGLIASNYSVQSRTSDIAAEPTSVFIEGNTATLVFSSPVQTPANDVTVTATPQAFKPSETIVSTMSGIATVGGEVSDGKVIENVTIDPGTNRIVLTAKGGGKFDAEAGTALVNFIITDSLSNPTGLLQHPNKVVLSEDRTKAILMFDRGALNAEQTRDLKITVRNAAFEQGRPITGISVTQFKQADLITPDFNVEVGHNTVTLTIQGGEFDPVAGQSVSNYSINPGSSDLGIEPVSIAIRGNVATLKFAAPVKERADNVKITVKAGAFKGLETAVTSVSAVASEVAPPKQEDVVVSNIKVSRGINRIVLTAVNGKFIGTTPSNFNITDLKSDGTGFSVPSKVVLSPDRTKAILSFDTPAQNLQTTDISIRIAKEAFDTARIVTEVTTKNLTQPDVTSQLFSVEREHNTVTLIAQNGEFEESEGIKTENYVVNNNRSDLAKQPTSVEISGHTATLTFAEPVSVRGDNLSVTINAKAFKGAEEAVSDVTASTSKVDKIMQRDVVVRGITVDQNANRIVLTAGQGGKFDTSNGTTVSNYVIKDSETDPTGFEENPSKVELSEDRSKAILMFDTPAANSGTVEDLEITIRALAFEEGTIVTESTPAQVTQADVTTGSITVENGHNTITLTTDGGHFDPTAGQEPSNYVINKGSSDIAEQPTSVVVSDNTATLTFAKAVGTRGEDVTVKVKAGAFKGAETPVSTVTGESSKVSAPSNQQDVALESQTIEDSSNKIVLTIAGGGKFDETQGKVTSNYRIAKGSQSNLLDNPNHVVLSDDKTKAILSFDEAAQGSTINDIGVTIDKAAFDSEREVEQGNVTLSSVVQDDVNISNFQVNKGASYVILSATNGNFVSTTSGDYEITNAGNTGVGSVLSVDLLENGKKAKVTFNKPADGEETNFRVKVKAKAIVGTTGEKVTTITGETGQGTVEVGSISVDNGSNRIILTAGQSGKFDEVGGVDTSKYSVTVGSSAGLHTTPNRVALSDDKTKAILSFDTAAGSEASNVSVTIKPEAFDGTAPVVTSATSDKGKQLDVAKDNISMEESQDLITLTITAPDVKFDAQEAVKAPNFVLDAKSTGVSSILSAILDSSDPTGKTVKLKLSSGVSSRGPLKITIKPAALSGVVITDTNINAEGSQEAVELRKLRRKIK